MPRGTVGGEGPPRLAEALQAAVVPLAEANRRWTVLFSGGLDSSLVAFLLRPLVEVELVTVGVPGAKDLRAARRGAELLGLPLEIRSLTMESVRAEGAAPRPEGTLLPEPMRSVRAAIALALASVRTGPVALGQGADELFYGYAHFRNLPEPECRARAEQDLAALRGTEWPWTQGRARARGLEIASPFLDERVVGVARSLPPPNWDGGEPPKARLREAARVLGLPPELAEAPKRAIQYGSGVARAIRSRARPG